MHISEQGSGNWWISVWAGLLLGSLAIADEPAAQTGPRIACDEASFDFGEIIDKEKVDHIFVLKNAGDSDLVISNVHTSCGCTTASLAKRTIAPGEPIDLVARFSLKGRIGHQEKRITVRSNDPVSPQFQLRLSGDIRRTIEVIPPAVSFGRIGIGKGTERKVTLSAASGIVFRVTGVVTDMVSFCDVRVDTIKEGSVYSVACTLRTNAVSAGGTISGRIEVNTDHALYPKIDIRVSGYMGFELMAIPSPLPLPRQDGNPAPMIRYLLVRSGNQKPFEILDVKTPIDSIQTKVDKLTGAGARIQISNLIASAELDGKEFEIRIRKWNGQEDILKVPVRIIPVSAPGGGPAKH